MPANPPAIHTPPSPSPTAPGAVHVPPVVGGVSIGTQQRHQRNFNGTVTNAGDIEVTVTAAIFEGGSKSYPFYVTVGQTGLAIVPQVVAALNADPEFNLYYFASGTLFACYVVNKPIGEIYPEPDPTLNISIQNIDAVGMTESLTSIETSPGSAGGSSLTAPPAIHAAPTPSPGTPPAITP